MIVDSSALLAILFDEPDAERYRVAIADHAPCRISAANYTETGLRLARDRANPFALRALDALVRVAALEIAPVTAEQARIAIEAYRDFGRGSASPAQLNFGDCFAYALARARGEPLLWKGDGFGHTDMARPGEAP